MGRLRSGDVSVVVSVSGGKDSTATALHLRELGIPCSFVFADTGWEADETYRFIDDVLEPAIGRIDRVAAHINVQPERAHLVDEVEAILGRSPSAMVRVCIQKAMFPSRKIRFCTTDLKIAPLREPSPAPCGAGTYRRVGRWGSCRRVEAPRIAGRVADRAGPRRNPVASAAAVVGRRRDRHSPPPRHRSEPAVPARHGTCGLLAVPERLQGRVCRHRQGRPPR